jgi:hypothetical protein
VSLDEIRAEGFKLAAGGRPMVVTRSSWGLTPFNRRGTVSLVRILYDVVSGARWRGESPNPSGGHDAPTRRWDLRL